MTLYEPCGGSDLCAWKVAKGVTWIQTRSPMFARKLSQRSDGQLMAVGVSGGYLRTFQFRKTIKWAKKLIARYTQADEATNERFQKPPAPVTRLKLPDGNRQRPSVPARFSTKIRTPLLVAEVGGVAFGAN
jgi:hypothetical protein